ncbi:MAG: hypothetical protein GC157_05950 [Frankiales bacterium]|nr:hypothetical protein [Frankiales bacterium]
MAAALDAGSSRAAGRLPEAAPGTPVDVLVVSGTVTHVLAPLVRRLVESAPGDPVVVSFGACACTGGPYWDSYAVADGVDTVVPVDVYVPGCPPPPEALREAVARAVALRAGAGGAP